MAPLTFGLTSKALSCQPHPARPLVGTPLLAVAPLSFLVSFGRMSRWRPSSLFSQLLLVGLVVVCSCRLTRSSAEVETSEGESDDLYMGHVNHIDLAAAAEAADALPPTPAAAGGAFSLAAGHRSGKEALDAYRMWHARTLASSEACAKAKALVWVAQAVSRSEHTRVVGGRVKCCKQV